MKKLRDSLYDIHDFKISEGEVAEKLQEAEALFGKDYAAISELIQVARVVYADETGWRMHGHNWWLWVYATDQGIRYVLEHTRGKGIPEETLGQNSKRVKEQLFTCLKYKNVLPENNTAERALRNSVVMRKIFGGSRSPDGARAHEVNNSVIDTTLIQNPQSSFFNAIIPLIKKRIEEKQGKLYECPSET